DRADADRAFDGGHERAEAGGGPILVSGGQGMAGIETDAETIGADAVEHLGELLEDRPQLAALAGRILEQDHRPVGGLSRRTVQYPLQCAADPLHAILLL